MFQIGIQGDINMTITVQRDVKPHERTASLPEVPVPFPTINYTRSMSLTIPLPINPQSLLALTESESKSMPNLFQGTKKINPLIPPPRSLPKSFVNYDEMNKEAKKIAPEKFRRISKALTEVKKKLGDEINIDSFNAVSTYFKNLYSVGSYYEWVQGWAIHPPFESAFENLKKNWGPDTVSYIDTCMKSFSPDVQDNLANEAAKFLVHSPTATIEDIKHEKDGIIPLICKYAQKPTESIMFAAALMGSAEMLKSCLNAKPSLDKVKENPKGLTPYQVALICERFNCCELLSEHGVKIKGTDLVPLATTKNKFDFLMKKDLITPLDIRAVNELEALKKEFKEISSNPLKHGVDPTIKLDYLIGFNYLAHRIGNSQVIVGESPWGKKISDLWHLVVSTNTKVIVMLSELRGRDNRAFCNPYWTEVAEVATHGGLTVETVKAETIYKDDRIKVVKRTLSVESVGEVVQFQVKNWFPKENLTSHSLAALVNLIALEVQNKAGNMLVHGPENAGHTATFYAAYWANINPGTKTPAELIKQGTLEVNRDGLEKMATAEQYILVHQALQSLRPTVPPYSAEPPPKGKEC